MVISLQFQTFVEDFSVSYQGKLREGLASASAAGERAGKVVIQSIASASFGVTRVVSMVAVDDATLAAYLRIKLGKFLLNSTALEAQGLPSFTLGAVSVTACPTGLELLIDAASLTGSDGRCELCPASYFCVGGSAGRVPCPVGSFAIAGSNSTADCNPAFFVLVAISLPISKDNFTSTLQGYFLDALAFTVGVNADLVTILSIQQEARRSSSTSVQLTTQIAVQDTALASTIRSEIDITKLNSQLLKLGLPGASLISVSVPGSDSGDTSVQEWVTGSAVSAAIVFLLFISIFLWASTRKVESHDERILRLKVKEIRNELCLSERHGFYLNSERPPFWKRSNKVVFMRRTHFEAAARLALGQEFEINLFDGFCLSVEGEGDDSSKERAERLKLLGNWLLKISEILIRPDSPDTAVNYPPSSVRFKFFVQKVAKARIWLEDETLFAELKRIAQSFLDKIAIDCELRYEEIYLDSAGKELVTFQSTEVQNTTLGQMIQAHEGSEHSHTISNVSNSVETLSLSNKKSIGSANGAEIRRQDDPQVSSA